MAVVAGREGGLAGGLVEDLVGDLGEGHQEEEEEVVEGTQLQDN